MSTGLPVLILSYELVPVSRRFGRGFWVRVVELLAGTKKIRRFLAEAPDDQAYLRVPSIPSVAWQPYPSPLGRLRAHSFASPSHDGFAFVEDGQKRRSRSVAARRFIAPTRDTPEL